MLEEKDRNILQEIMLSCLHLPWNMAPKHVNIHVQVWRTTNIKQKRILSLGESKIKAKDGTLSKWKVSSLIKIFIIWLVKYSSKNSLMQISLHMKNINESLCHLLADLLKWLKCFALLHANAICWGKDRTSQELNILIGWTFWYTDFNWMESSPKI